MKNRRNFIKNALAFTAGGFALKLLASTAKSNISRPNGYLIDSLGNNKEVSNRYNISADKVKWIKEATLF